MLRPRVACLLALVALGCGGSEKTPHKAGGSLQVRGQVLFEHTPLLGSAAMPLELKNTGETTMTVKARVNPPFAVSPAQVQLAPGRFTILTVQFLPDREGQALRTLWLDHAGGGAHQVLLVGEGVCACDDGNALTKDSCGDLGRCQHEAILCTEEPPDLCWELAPREQSHELGCHFIKKEDGTPCGEATGLCHPGGTCRSGRCERPVEADLSEAFAIPIADPAVLAEGDDIYAMSREGKLLEVKPDGTSRPIGDLTGDARLVLVAERRVLVSSGNELRAFSVDAIGDWTVRLPDGTTEPWRFAAGPGTWYAVGGTREADPCRASTDYLPIDPDTGITATPQHIEEQSPTGTAIAGSGELYISTEGCFPERLLYRELNVDKSLGPVPRFLLGIADPWFLTQDKQYSDEDVMGLPASDGFPPLERTLEPLSDGSTGWLFDCTAPDCGAPATATGFTPGSPFAGIRLDLHGGAPSALLLQGGGLAVAVQSGERTRLLIADGQGVSESCPVPGGMRSLVTVAGGRLIAVAPDPGGGYRLTGYDAPGLVLSPAGWVASGGNPARTRRPLVDTP